MNALVVSALLATALLVPSAPAEATAPTCQGKRATVVGQPNGSAEGTPGNDVIVTNGAYEAKGKAGKDLICITKERSTVHAGPGDDTVVSRVIKRPAATYLGSGDDVYIGNDGPDVVLPQNGRDVVRTLGGADSIGLHQGHPQATVDLGAGDDDVIIGLTAGGSRVDGGAGTNTLRVSARNSSDPRLWRFDAVRGQATLNKKPILRYQDLQDYDLIYLGGKADRVVVKGNADDETVDLNYAYHDQGRRLRLELGAGDDEVLVSALDQGSLELGKGRDRFTVVRATSADIDLGGSVADVVTDDDVVSHFSISGVDDVLTRDVPEVTIDGDEGGNTLSTDDVCAATIRGLGGDDTLVLDSGACEDEQSGALYGGAGDDTLRGGYRDDLLDGGPGTDAANGGSGQDTCLAEKRLYCELP